MKSTAPKSFQKYEKCIHSKCRSQHKALELNKYKLENGMKKCVLTKKTSAGRRKCFKSLVKSLPETKNLTKCSRKLCKSQRNKLRKSLKTKKSINDSN